MYHKYGKRVFDFLLSAVLLIILMPVFIILSIKVKKHMGSPIFFYQKRPGKGENIFNMVKFRTMTNQTDKKRNLLSDEKRLTPFGRWLRETSLDELPELWNILKGDMSFVGPRPQLIKDMIFMTKEQRKRHKIYPGLTGLAQINGRNNISWEDKLALDLEYSRKITFFGDLKILFQTFWNVIEKKDITQEGMETAQDYGEYLLESGKITKEEYQKKLEYCAAKERI